MDATRLLISHHRKMTRTFKAITTARGHAPALVTEMADELAAHMVIEEFLFYPAVRSLKDALVLEGYEEHVNGRFALTRLLATRPSAETFKAKVKALKDMMEDHNDEEEEKLFPTVERVMSAERLRQLGDEMKALFDATVKAGCRQGLRRLAPDPSRRARIRPHARTATL